MKKEPPVSLPCADAGTRYCPCFLALVGECLTCTHLQGFDLCDCSWPGLCVLQHFQWESGVPRPGREEVRSRIIDVRRLSDTHVSFTFSVPSSVTPELAQPGAMVFARAIHEPSRFDVPLTIYDTGEDSATVVLEVVGPKTRSLASWVQRPGNLGDVWVRGPYFNGVFGGRYLKALHSSRALLVLRGTGQATSLSVAREMVRHRNLLWALLDPGPLEHNLAEEALRELGVQVFDIDLRTKTGEEFLASCLERFQPALVFSGGADGQHYRLERLMEARNLRATLTGSNNCIMVCAEGTCGACITRLRSGGKFRACKGDAPVNDVFLDTSLLWKPEDRDKGPREGGRVTPLRRPEKG
ncbi:MAG: hypothetical protein AB1576_06540 [Bacillota bacterium]